MIASIKYHVAIKIAVINYMYSQWKYVPKQVGKQNAQHNPTCICIIYFKDLIVYIKQKVHSH